MAGKLKQAMKKKTAATRPFPRQFTPDDPGTPEEIQRAFYSPVVGAPPPEMSQQQYQRRRPMQVDQGNLTPEGKLFFGSTGVDFLNRLRSRGGQQPAQMTTPQGSAFRQHLTQNALRTGDMTGADIEGVSPAEFGAQSRLIQSTRGHNPARQMPRGPAPEPGTPGFGEGYYQGQSGVTVPGVGRRASNQSLGSGRVGTGFQSTGMNTGGAFGSSLMMVGGLRAAMGTAAMGGVPQQQRQPAVDPYETAQGTRTRMLQSVQRPPSVIQLPDGTVRVIGSAGGRQAEPNEDQLAKRAAYAAKLAGRQSAVENRGIARGQARESRREFARDQQYFGHRGALVRAFQRSGEDPMRAMAMMGAMGGNNNAAQFLSEDNRQRRAADEFRTRSNIEGQRESREQLQMRWTPRLAEAQAILNNPAATITEKNRAKQIMQDYDQSLTTAFGMEAGTPPMSQPTAPEGTQTALAGTQTAPEGTVPFGSSGVMVDPMAMPQLEAAAANYSQNPAQVGQQLVQMLNTDSFAHLTPQQKVDLLREITGNRFATLDDPSGMSQREVYDQQRNQGRLHVGPGYAWVR